MAIPLTSIVSALPASTPFVGPETLERQRGKSFAARIGANESSFGLSPRAVAAMSDAVSSSNWYGDPENFELRQALAAQHGVDADEICVDAGIDTLLGVAVRMLVEPNQSVVSSTGAYPTFNYHVSGYGGQLVSVPYLDDHEDPQALIAATVEHKAPMLYLANPDNPMGTWHDAGIIQDFLDEIPDGSVAALDEAYIEFAAEDVAPPIDTSQKTVIRFRTFSKAYGMAGARIGYAIAHRDLITGMNKIRNHFGVNRIAQAGALASVQDAEFLQSVKHAVESGRQRIYQLAEKHHLTAIPSATNFVSVDLGSSDRAKKALDALIERNIFIRMPGVAPLNRCIRIGIGTDAEHAVFESAFTEVMSEL